MTNKPTHHGAITEAIKYIRKVKEIFLVDGQDPVVLQKLEALRDAVPDKKDEKYHDVEWAFFDEEAYLDDCHELLHEALEESEG